MATSSDEIIKREILEKVGETKNLDLRIFTQSSNQDQKLVEEDGLTFSYKDVNYGSCDAAWFDKKSNKPIIALEGTDALNRKSSGNAQYQRFHHALGAVKLGLLGIYYLKKGVDKIQEDLYGMAYFASKEEKGTYLIVDDLSLVKDIINAYGNEKKYNALIREHLSHMYSIFINKFENKYKSDWENFAIKRSTIIKNGYIVKYAGRMRRNFTDGSQRAGHIAVGEMFLTKYYFIDKKFYYLFLKMTQEDINYLDKNKSDDKEWYLLRHEENVEIKTLDDLNGLPVKIKNDLIKIINEPLKGEALRIYKKCVAVIEAGLRDGDIKINQLPNKYYVEQKTLKIAAEKKFLYKKKKIVKKN
jgi:hypothetical protein